MSSFDSLIIDELGISMTNSTASFRTPQDYKSSEICYFQITIKIFIQITKID